MFPTAKIYCLLLLIVVVCGYKRVRFSGMQAKIVGGHEVKITEHPYMVKLEISSDGGAFLCGGSYIKPLWVLTASHCLDANDHDTSLPPIVGTELTRVKCIMGIDDTDTAQSVQKQRSVQLFMHPQYQRNDSFVCNDIGLIQLREPFNLSSTVQMIPTPTTSLIAGGETVTIIGWGAVGGFLSGMPHQLQALDTIAHSIYDCKRVTESPSVICIGERGSIACSGDSGGPLIFRKTVVGVCSYGFGCGGEVAVYESVFSHREWLRNVSGEESQMKPSSLGGTKWNFFFCGCIAFVVSMYFNNIEVD